MLRKCKKLEQRFIDVSRTIAAKDNEAEQYKDNERKVRAHAERAIAAYQEQKDKTTKLKKEIESIKKGSTNYDGAKAVFDMQSQRDAII